MKKLSTILIITLFLAGFLSESGRAQENKKLAQTGFQFLSVVSDARGAAMADALTSLQVGSSALFFNPAGMAEMTTYFDVTGSTNKWIADINHYVFSFAINPFNGDYGVFGISAQLVDYGDFYGTIVNRANPQGYDDTGIFNLSALAIGIGYAKHITDRFSIGGQVKYVRQDLGESIIPVNIRVSSTDSNIRTADTTTTSNKISPLVFDFGTQFRTGIKSLVFGMSIRNFSKEVKYVDEGIQAPMVFTLGVSMNVLDLFDKLPFKQSLFISLDASHYRDHPEQVKIGVDYNVMDIFSFRGGYVSNNDQNDFTYGLGVSKYGFSFDYSFTPFGVFNNVQRFTVRYAL
jgi:hypothetical protein